MATNGQQIIDLVIHGMISRGVRAVEIDGNGHLIFTLTDGTTKDLGKVVGDAFTYEDFTQEQLAALKGDTGAQGPQGETGPNAVSAETTTALNGILKGNGSNVAVAVAGTDYASPENLNTKVNRTTAVNEADTNYTTLMARGEKLMAKADFDAVTDWSTELVNGAIAWGYA